MQFTIVQTGYFHEEVYFEVPDETIKQKLKEYQLQGMDYYEAKEALEDFIHYHRWDYQTDYGDRDDDVDDYDYQSDFYDGLNEAMENYDEQEEDVGEL